MCSQTTVNLGISVSIIALYVATGLYAVYIDCINCMRIAALCASTVDYCSIIADREIIGSDLEVCGFCCSRLHHAQPLEFII